MQLIVITPPEWVEQEQQVCVEMFELGLKALHLRKPEANVNKLRNWLEALPEQYHNRVMLHTHHALAEEFAVKGLHFREVNRAAAGTTPKLNLTFSTSFHALEDIRKTQPHFDYALLSPIFQSISKKGYPAAFAFDELKQTLSKATLPIIALGGITAKKLPQVQDSGFAGAAMLGAIWEHPKPVEAFKKLLKVV